MSNHSCRAPSLDQLDLVTFRRIDERDGAAVAMFVRPIRKRITFRFRVFGELLQVVDLEREMGQIGSDDHRTAFVEFADLDLLLASRRLEKDELRAATGSVATRFFQSEHVSDKSAPFFPGR